MSPDDQPDLDPVLADAVRGAYVRPVDEVTARRHVSAIVAAASAGTAPVARRPRQRRRLWRPVLAAGAATLLAPVGLAVAGVSLPDAVEEPYRTVGITLPNQTPAQPAPAARPATPGAPSTTPATAAPPRPTDRHGQRQRGKQKVKPADRARRKDNSRGSSTVRPRPSPGGTNKQRPSPRPPAGPQNKPKSPKPSPSPSPKKPGKSNKKATPPRAPRTRKGKPTLRPDAPKSPAGASATGQAHGR